mmetsp:Transcript_92945/g.267395  ORF Transcript_92945/g.267395 Transcript_92945/m.267395 type:complete len:254 (+) Transcript_92945:117-878(+)
MRSLSASAESGTCRRGEAPHPTQEACANGMLHSDLGIDRVDQRNYLGHPSEHRRQSEQSVRAPKVPLETVPRQHLLMYNLNRPRHVWKASRTTGLVTTPCRPELLDCGLELRRREMTEQFPESSDHVQESRARIGMQARSAEERLLERGNNGVALRIERREQAEGAGEVLAGEGQAVARASRIERRQCQLHERFTKLRLARAAAPVQFIQTLLKCGHGKVVQEIPVKVVRLFEPEFVQGRAANRLRRGCPELS